MLLRKHSAFKQEDSARKVSCKQETVQERSSGLGRGLYNLSRNWIPETKGLYLTILQAWFKRRCCCQTNLYIEKAQRQFHTVWLICFVKLCLHMLFRIYFAIFALYGFGTSLPFQRTQALNWDTSYQFHHEAISVKQRKAAGQPVLKFIHFPLKRVLAKWILVLVTFTYLLILQV